MRSPPSTSRKRELCGQSDVDHVRKLRLGADSETVPMSSGLTSYDRDNRMHADQALMSGSPFYIIPGLPATLRTADVHGHADPRQALARQVRSNTAPKERGRGAHPSFSRVKP